MSFEASFHLINDDHPRANPSTADRTSYNARRACIPAAVLQLVRKTSTALLRGWVRSMASLGLTDYNAIYFHAMRMGKLGESRHDRSQMSLVASRSSQVSIQLSCCYVYGTLVNQSIRHCPTPGTKTCQNEVGPGPVRSTGRRFSGYIPPAHCLRN